MLPNSQLYMQNYRCIPNLCDLKSSVERCAGYPIPEDTTDYNTVYDNIKKDTQLQKTLQIIEKAGMKKYFGQAGDLSGADTNGITMFACIDEKITQSFVDDVSLFRARTFLNSYTLKGAVNIKYLVDNGTSLYITRSSDNPIFCVVNQSNYTVGGNNRRDTEIVINGVGRVVKEIKCSNGTILLLDNIASPGYVNGTY